MNSKEALNELLYYATLDDSGFEPYMKEYANQIEKDLEVLEILKSHARLTELNSVCMGRPKTIIIAIEPDDDGYEIVKRWLENDNK